MPEPGKNAVFVSYASQDAEVANSLCEALRGAGIEVWFDQNELKGGDLWDIKIRKQVMACSLFVPLISQNTNEREEGYFRREWNLAVTRTLDMAHDKAFILPVMVDGIAEATARVPDKFREVHWTKVRNGEVPEEFVSIVRKLLTGTVPPFRTPAPSAPAASFRFKFSHALSLVVGGLLVLLAYGVFSKKPAVAEKAAAERVPTTAVLPKEVEPAAPVLDETSIAVLPFANLSGDPTQEYFSDGISEEILNRLQQNRALRVIARTSSFSYKGKNVPIAQIASELRVGMIIEGSVRRDGNQVRIMAHLIRSREGTPLWSQSFTGEMSGIFAVQDEIAMKIAARLQPDAPKIPATPPAALTSNIEAYNAYLRGREQQLKSFSTVYQLKAAAHFERATELDPSFALAWAQLARTRVVLSSTGGTNDEERDLQLARIAIDQARRLQPDLASVHLAEATFRVFGERDYDAGLRELDLVTRLQPEDSESGQLRANIEMRRGRFAVAADFAREATLLDPNNTSALNVLGLALAMAGQYKEAVTAFERVIRIDESNSAIASRALTLFAWQGDPAAAADSAPSLSPDRISPAGLRTFVLLNLAAGRHDRALELAAGAPWTVGLGTLSYEFRDLMSAQIRQARGDTAGAKRDYLAALVEAERIRDLRPRSPRIYGPLALIYAGLGRKDEALAAARKGLDLVTPDRDPYFTALKGLRVMAEVLVSSGRVDEALEITRTQIAAKLWKRNELLLSPDFASLQRDPRFRALAEAAPK